MSEFGAKLYVVCTPIGNLDDLTPRAAHVLRSAALILAEDTRHSQPLLDVAGVPNGTLRLSCHQHNEMKRVDIVLDKLKVGDTVAMITDAGTPGISDPGGRMIAAVVEAGFEVAICPGPSAPVAALMGAGLDVQRFAFLGFLPRKGKERSRWVLEASRMGLALVLFESPNRVERTLEDLHEWCGDKRVVVARELTKWFETFHRGTLGQPLSPPLVPKGEIVIVVEAGQPLKGRLWVDQGDISLEELLDSLAQEEGLSAKEAARRLAAQTGMMTRQAYQLIVEKRKK